MPKITKLVTGRSAIQTLQPTLWPENDRTRICLKQEMEGQKKEKGRSRKEKKRENENQRKISQRRGNHLGSY